MGNTVTYPITGKPKTVLGEPRTYANKSIISAFSLDEFSDASFPPVIFKTCKSEVQATTSVFNVVGDL